MRKKLLGLMVAGAAGAFTLAACSNDDGDQAVAITFRPQVGTAAFACDVTYGDIGTTGSEVQFTDFKLYVSNVRLVTASGAEETVSLEQDGEWQLDDVALLDFDNGTGGCEGSTQTNYQVTGTVASGTYTGIKFTMGIPFVLNHGDAATAAAPLNSTDMFWVWNAGYKFLRLDLISEGQPGGFPVHVGSTGCDGATATTPPTTCSALNEAEVSLTGFDVEADVIVVDPKPLLATTNVDASADMMPGCMSSPTDPECVTIFPRIGLPIGATPAGAQVFFRVAAE